MLDEILISEQISILDSMKKMDELKKKVLFVTKNKKLLGTLTDGDIRRWILSHGSLDAEVVKASNYQPKYLVHGTKEQAKSMMKEFSIEAVPIVDENLHIKSIVFWNDLELTLEEKKLSIPIVIMSGGKGTRLYPYTKIIPKPLIPIGDVPIVERILNQYLSYQCNQFYMTVNYKKELIKSYFESKNSAYSMEFLEEQDFFGTAGSLTLLKGKVNSTFVVNNCDVIIEADYADILSHHRKSGNKITMVTSLKNYTIPYGVIELNEIGGIANTKEKPEYNFFVNTGMYFLEPEILEDIPEHQFYHITDLIDKYVQQGENVGTYPLTENSWYDMGELKEMERMIERFG